MLVRAMFALLLILPASLACAHEGTKHKNLQVLQDDHQAIDKGMKTFAEGLGVKCTVCHVKGFWEKDDVATKPEARKFLGAVVGETDEAKKKAALAQLLAVLKIEAPKDEAVIWRAVSGWKKKAN